MLGRVLGQPGLAASCPSAGRASLAGGDALWLGQVPPAAAWWLGSLWYLFFLLPFPPDEPCRVDVVYTRPARHGGSVRVVPRPLQPLVRQETPGVGVFVMRRVCCCGKFMAELSCQTFY